MDESLLGKSITSDQFGAFSGIGAGSDLASGSYRSGAYNYNVADNGNGTRTVTRSIYEQPMPTLDDAGGSSLDFYKNQLLPGQNSALNDYLMKMGSQDSPLDIYEQLSQSEGLPELKKTASTIQGQINQLEDSLRRVEGNVNKTTMNSYVTEGQKDLMVQDRREPLMNNLSELGTGLGRTMNAIQFLQSDIGNRTNMALEGQKMQMEPYKLRYEAMADQAAVMMTGFTQDRQARLDLLLAQWSRGNQLQDRELDELSELSRMDKEYQMQKDMFMFQAQNTPASTEIVTVGGRKQLINSQTGEVIRDLGSSSTGTSSDSSWLQNWMNQGSGSTSESGWEVVETPSSGSVSSTNTMTAPPKIEDLWGGGGGSW